LRFYLFQTLQSSCPCSEDRPGAPVRQTPRLTGDIISCSRECNLSEDIPVFPHLF
jgi:hypothetical protein